MTRITNFGWKRSYVEAGFSSELSQATTTSEVPTEVEDMITAKNTNNSETTELLSTKKRKRTKKAELTDDTGEGRLFRSESNNSGGVGIHPQDEDQRVGVTRNTSGSKPVKGKLNARQKAKNQISKGALDLQIDIGVFLISCST